ncbi:MAG: DUF1707 SHOCT-like domain-containing protein, partial [Solirubrobacteraceae bacterium]
MERPVGQSDSGTSRSTHSDPEPPAQRSTVSPTRLASDEDRARAERALRDNYAHGRLALDELTGRIATVQGGRTIGELRSALRDLPGDPWAVAEIVPAAEDQARTGLILALISVVVPLPPLVLGLTGAGLGARSLLAGVTARRGQAVAAVAIGGAVAFVQLMLLVIWLA